MSNIKRIQWLKEKHREHHKMIEAAEAEKAPDEFITRLKKEKLQYKDEIERLEWNADEYQGGVEMFGVYGQKPLVQK
tara:strand:+ start:570 stop:800 length:231 start_codon:yes stop_codon:yes gene_type:complete